MKFLLIIISFFSVTQPIWSQIITDKSNYDFKDLRKEDPKYVDFKFTNASNEDIHILRTEEPYGTKVKFSKKKLKPDSSAFVRIKYTPKRKGYFNVDVPVWVSSNNEPITLSVKGKVISFDNSESNACPDFSFDKKIENREYQLKVTVVEKKTKRPIEDAQIDILWDGVMYKTLMSNEDGKVSKTLKQDIYYLIANAEGYETAELDHYFNIDNQELTIELGPQEDELALEPKITEVIPTDPVIVKTDSGQALQDEPKRILPKKVEKDPPKKEKPPKFADKVEVTSKDLPETKFAPNNIVFLIDVSVSMKRNGKLELLKASMIELTNLLRNTDKVAIVTYSSRTNIVLPSTSAKNKAEITAVIKSLEAGGNTEGAKGIKKAYMVLNNNFITKGNNQIFISTDGAFNLEKKDKKLIPIVKRNAKKGSKLSVLGIKNSKWTVDNMKKIASNGKGNYIHIEDYKSAKSSLVEEIKKQSLRR